MIALVVGLSLGGWLGWRMDRKCPNVHYAEYRESSVHNGDRLRCYYTIYYMRKPFTPRRTKR